MLKDYRRHSPTFHICVLPYHRGFSMIELLVTLIIFSIGFLGIASLQMQGMRLVHDAELMGRANMLANTLADKLRAHGPQLDTTDWSKQVEENLPRGRGSLTRASQIFTIQVEWLESQDSHIDGRHKSYQLDVIL